MSKNYKSELRDGKLLFELTVKSIFPAEYVKTMHTDKEFDLYVRKMDIWLTTVEFESGRPFPKREYKLLQDFYLYIRANSGVRRKVSELYFKRDLRKKRKTELDVLCERILDLQKDFKTDSKASQIPEFYRFVVGSLAEMRGTILYFRNFDKSDPQNEKALKDWILQKHAGAIAAELKLLGMNTKKELATLIVDFMIPSGYKEWPKKTKNGELKDNVKYRVDAIENVRRGNWLD
jgi:hypothetical protein